MMEPNRTVSGCASLGSVHFFLADLHGCDMLFFVIIDFYASHGWIMSTTSSDVSSHLSENMSDYWSFPDIVHSSTST